MGRLLTAAGITLTRFVEHIGVQYIEQTASFLAWACGRYSPPTCAGCAIRSAYSYEAEVSRSYLSQLEKGAFYASLKIVGKVGRRLGRGACGTAEGARPISV
jgi:hypothetical protein